VLTELIDDKLKVHVARRYRRGAEARIETTYAGIARRAGFTPDQFAKGDGAARASARRCAEGAHSRRPSGRRSFAASSNRACRSAKEVAVKLGARGEATGYDYGLRPILFLVRAARRCQLRGAQERGREPARTLPELRRGAETRHGAAGRRGARCISRQSVDLGQAAARSAQQYAGRPADRETTSQGVETFAVCQKNPAVGGDTPRERQLRDTIFQERYQAISKKYMKELRAQALIEIR
jgi:peptidyl-prolyl cis-trans isomerase SurA